MNNRGMSLLGVLAALGLVGILAVGVLSLSQNMMAVIQAGDFNTQIQDDIFIAKVNLSKEYNCTANLKDLTIGSKLTAEQMKLRLAKSAKNLNLSKSYIIPTQDPLNTSSKVNILSMELKPYPDSENLALLSISFEAKNSKMVGGSVRTREIPLEVVLDGGKIQKCSAGTSTLDPDDEELTDGKSPQGRACSSDPQGKGGASPKDLKAYISDVCDYQTYPVTDGLLVKQADIKPCIKYSPSHGGVGGGRAASWSVEYSTRCKTVAELYTTESHSPFGKEDIHLLTRNNFKNAEECKKQKLYSEGNRVARKLDSEYSSASTYTVKTCVNHLWTSDTGGMGVYSGMGGGVFNPGGSDGGDH